MLKWFRPKAEVVKDPGVFAWSRITVVEDDKPKKPLTLAEQVEALIKRVADLEKETSVYSDDESPWYSITTLTHEKPRPRVGEGVRLLMEHLGLTFRGGQKAPDALVKAKKARKKK